MYPTKELASLRDQTISELIGIYGTLDDVASKKIVLAGLKKAMSLPSLSDYGRDIEELVRSDFQRVIAFYNEIAGRADAVELEEIESQALFFQFRGLGHGTESPALQQLREKLSADPEYAIYKLLAAGHDAFEDYWNDRVTWSFEAHEKFRIEKINELVARIDGDNLDEWTDRILAIKERASPYSYRQYFLKFLDSFGGKKPELALALLRGKHEELGWFVAPLLDGLWDSKLHDELSDLVCKWVGSSQHLDAIVRLLAAKKIENERLIADLMSQAVKADAQDVLCELMAIAVDRFTSHEQFYMEVFLKSLSALPDDNTAWCGWARFQRSFPVFIAALDEPSINLILSRLLKCNDVSYEIEEILRPIAATHPEKIVSFFAQRRKHESQVRNKEVWPSRYDAIPFQFHELHDELGKHPALVFNAIYEWFSEDTLWAWEAARLLANIFQGLPPNFETMLMDKVRNGTEKDTLNVLSILKEYDGDTRIHDVCKEAIKRFPESKDVRTAALIALDATGVVSGEFGFRDAHLRKKEETASWLKDADAGVRAFAEYYQNYLASRIERETTDAERDIAIRKKIYGEGSKEP